MSYDTKRLQTFKWAEKIVSKSRFEIMMYCGRMYVTDEILLAKIDYPEFKHLADYEWSNVIRYFDDDGKLLEVPELEPMAKPFKDNRIFEEMFVNRIKPFEINFDPAVMERALKVFKINKINPNLFTDEVKIGMSGHNRDVSIEVVMMGIGNG